MTRALHRSAISVPGASIRKRVRTRDWPRPPRRDPHTRVIAQLVELAGANSSVIATSTRPWASATFVGAQHRIILRMTGSDRQTSAKLFVEQLPEAEFSIPGHIVADACLDEWHVGVQGDESCPEPNAQEPETAITLQLSVLTIEEW